jgi:hypothetical protein
MGKFTSYKSRESRNSPLGLSLISIAINISSIPHFPEHLKVNPK